MVSSGNLRILVKSTLHLHMFSLIILLAVFSGGRVASAQTVATPTFSLAAGTYSTPQTMTISDSTPGATIYYSAIGSPEIGDYGTVQYTGPINLVSFFNGYVPATLYAMAVATGYTQSATASEAFDFVVGTPTFGPSGGTYSSAQTVTISDVTPGVGPNENLWYTTDGTTPNAGSLVYTGPIPITASTTLQAISEYVTGYNNSAVGTAIYTLQVATPTFSPAAGTYSTAQTVTISDSTSGATIYYTTNGSSPTTASPVYSSAITVSSTETLKALATETGYTNSAVGSAAYTLQVATPTFSPAAGTYTSAQSVSISDTTTGATIYYTTNGNTPTTASSVYSSAIAVSATETLKALATHSGVANSAVGSAVYTIQVATPGFSPAAGTYTSPQTVTITDSTSGASIYYTTNGSTPTTASTLYSSAIAVSATETLKALATHSGQANSAVASAVYTIR